MKSLIFFIFFLNSIILIKSVVPNWDLSKIGKNKRSGNTYTRVVDVKDKKWNEIHLKLTTTFTFENGKVNKENILQMEGKGTEVDNIERIVNFDNVDNFYYLNKNYYVCPIGKYHIYDYSAGEHVKPEGFDDNIDFEFKCVYHAPTSVLLAFYLINRKYAMYAIYIGKGDDIKNMNHKGLIGQELYDFRLSDYLDEGKYLIMTLNMKDSKIRLTTLEANLETGYQGVNEIGINKDIIDCKNNIRASFRNESSKYLYDFFYITYNDLSDLISGYSNYSASYRNIENADAARNTTSAHLEFFEDLEIEEIHFMFSNRFLYYKLKEKNTDTTKYYGIFDTKLNKVVFNTNENLLYYIPHSETEMLAVTQNEAYIICAFEDNEGKCVDYCEGDNYFLSTQGNKCISPVCPKITLVPSGICNETCDTTYYFEKDGLCGLCQFFNSSEGNKLLGGTKCLPNSAIDNKMVPVNAKLGLYKCDDRYILKDNQCKTNCPEHCAECQTENSCDKCDNEFLKEGNNCQEHCTERRGVINNSGTCENCPDTVCEKFKQDRCECEKCKLTNYFINSSNICSLCDSNCNSCEGDAKNCTSCPEGTQLLNNTCYNCQDENCAIKESDNCRCNKCNDGFYVENYECKECNETCKTCSSESICIECQEGYYIQDNKCNSCNNSISNCKKCNNSTVCEQCAEHFYKDLSGKCRACPSVCEKTKSDKCQCETCINGYYMDNDECQKCSDKCQACEGSSDKCTSCKNANQFVDNEGKCQDCDSNCKTCSIKGDNCTSCESNEYLDKGNNTCNLCSEICDTCSSGELNGEHNCLSCKNNWYLILDDYNKTCVDNCTEYGREFFNDSYYVCKPLRKTNNTENDGGGKGNSDSIDYLLWIFVSVIGVLLLIITICICKKCCCNKYDSEVIEEITTELDEKEIIN